MYQWKKFQFFQKEELKIPKVSEPSPHVTQCLESVEQLTCADGGRGFLVLGDGSSGRVHCVRGGLRWSSFNAYQRRVTAVHQLQKSDTLITVGDDDDSDARAILKVWELKIPVDPGEPPPPVAPSPMFKTANASEVVKGGIRVFESRTAGDYTQVTCLRASEDLQFIAAGLQNGAIILFRGDIRGGRSTSTKLPPAQSTAPVTGLFFKQVNPSVPTALFAVTTDAVSTHLLHDEGRPVVSETLESTGCEMGCCAQSASGDVLVGRTEAIFRYNYDGGNCSPAGFFSFEGEKKLLMSFNGYLLVIGVGARDDTVDQCSVYDLANKFVAAFNPFPSGVKRVFFEWNSVVVLTKDNRVYRLKEKGIADKLEMLYRKNLFDVAAELAKAHGYDQKAVAEIYKRYGDHQYSRGEFDSAMTQYLHTIGHGLEPSYVIRRYVDTGGVNRIDNLVRYLQKLHEDKRNCPTADHTTLLLNCYTQLGNLDQLDEFIKRDGLEYDVETAINVCRQAGFYEQGLYLAEKHDRHRAWLRIQLGRHKAGERLDGPGEGIAAPPVAAHGQISAPPVADSADFVTALDYIKRLPTFEDAKSAIKEYGRLLLAQLPEQTTRFVRSLCTGYTAAGRPPAKPDTRLEAYMDIFLGDDESLQIFLETTLAELTAKEEELSRHTTRTVNETLLELYLQRLQEIGQDTSPELVRKAMGLLENMDQSKVGQDHALVLCDQYDFSQGRLHLLMERPGMHRQILVQHMDDENFESLIQATNQFAKVDETLWLDVLRYFTSKGNTCTDEIQQVLQLIEKARALPPIMVVEALASGPSTTLEVCQAYLKRQLQDSIEKAKEDAAEAEEYRQDTEAARKEMAAQLQQRGASSRRVDSEQALTETPTKYFLRRHAQHLESIGLGPQAHAGSKLHENFRSELATAGPARGGAMLLGSSGGFDVVSKHFSDLLFA